jgi:hypothetical protein
MIQHRQPRENAEALYFNLFEDKMAEVKKKIIAAFLKIN